jgi:hypothetical protein
MGSGTAASSGRAARIDHGGGFIAVKTDSLQRCARA